MRCDSSPQPPPPPLSNTPPAAACFIQRCRTTGGHDVVSSRREAGRLIGWCPQFDGLLELLTVREHLELFGRIKGVRPERALAAEVDRLLLRLDLRAFAGSPAGSLSGGNKRKLSLACALVGRPTVVFLDEPSTGMDPAARRFMWGVISELSQSGEAAVILTTHR